MWDEQLASASYHLASWRIHAAVGVEALEALCSCDVEARLRVWFAGYAPPYPCNYGMPGISSFAILGAYQNSAKYHVVLMATPDSGLAGDTYRLGRKSFPLDWMGSYIQVERPLDA